MKKVTLLLLPIALLLSCSESTSPDNKPDRKNKPATVNADFLIPVAPTNRWVYDVWSDNDPTDIDQVTDAFSPNISKPTSISYMWYDANTYVVKPLPLLQGQFPPLIPFLFAAVQRDGKHMLVMAEPNWQKPDFSDTLISALQIPTELSGGEYLYENLSYIDQVYVFTADTLITVPAGTFHCVGIRFDWTTEGQDVIYFSKGIGIVRSETNLYYRALRSFELE